MEQAPTPPSGSPTAIEQNQVAAQLMLRKLGAANDQTMGQMTSASSWLLATLVAINGGGALATINLLPRLEHPAWPASLFAAGLLFVVLSGVAIRHTAEALLTPIATQEVFWRKVEATITQAKINRSSSRASRLSTRAHQRPICSRANAVRQSSQQSQLPPYPPLKGGGA